MPTVPDDLLQRLRAAGQEHVLRWWDRLNDDERQDNCSTSCKPSTWSNCQHLYADRDHAYTPPSWDAIRPVPVVPADSPDNRATRRLGEEALRRGEVAVLVVAGGQGSRLGFDHPKGMFPIGPVSSKSLFQIHAEKVLALRRRYGKPLPFLVMTSPATDAETRRSSPNTAISACRRTKCIFFRQGTMPALDLATGKLLLEAPGRLFLSPDGHGGTLTALADSGLLDRLREQRHPPDLLFPGGQSAGEGGRPGVPRPSHRRSAPRCRRKVDPQAGPDRQARQLRAGRRPLHHDRVFRPARGPGPADRRDRAGCACGRAARPSTFSTSISWRG